MADNFSNGNNSGSSSQPRRRARHFDDYLSKPEPASEPEEPKAARENVNTFTTPTVEKSEPLPLESQPSQSETTSMPRKRTRHFGGEEVSKPSDSTSPVVNHTNGTIPDFAKAYRDMAPKPEPSLEHSSQVGEPVFPKSTPLQFAQDPMQIQSQLLLEQKIARQKEEQAAIIRRQKIAFLREEEAKERERLQNEALESENAKDQDAGTTKEKSKDSLAEVSPDKEKAPGGNEDPSLETADEEGDENAPTTQAKPAFDPLFPPTPLYQRPSITHNPLPPPPVPKFVDPLFAEKSTITEVEPKPVWEPEPVAPVEAQPSTDEEPDTFYAWAMQSYNKMRDGDEEGAWQAAQKALTMGTDEPDLYVPLCQQFPPKRRRQLANDAMKIVPPTHDAFQWLWVEVAMSFWYERNYKEALAEYDTILMQKNIDAGLYSVIVNGAAMSLEALGMYNDASDRYLQIGNQEAAVKAKARSGDAAGALMMIQKGIGPADKRVRDATEGMLSCLIGRPLPDLPSRIETLKEMEEEWLYKDFMLGVMLVVSTKGEQGIDVLERFLTICNNNPNEWGATLRWEIGVVQEVLYMLGL